MAKLSPILLTICLALVGCKTVLSQLDKISSVPADYQTERSITLPLERKYTQMGRYSVKSQSFTPSGKVFQNLKIWYPAEMETLKRQYPLVIFANGTGIPHNKYEALFEHLASWGFIVVGNDDKNSWSGLSSSQSLDFVLEQSKDRNSIYYQKINTSQVGLSGHSQGGVAVINAATNHSNGKLYSSVFGASTTKHSLALGLRWAYDTGKLNIPYFTVAGMGVFDAGNGKDKDGGITPLGSMIENFDKLPANTPAVRARRKNADHGQMLYIADGYMTAWFLYTLTNDNEAKRVFAGNNPEIQQNSNWQDVKIKNMR